MAEEEQPKVQVTAGDDDISPDIISSIVTKRESSIADCQLIANDEKGRQYLATLDAGSRIVAKYKYEDGDDIWKTVFDGKVESLNPNLSEEGEVLSVTAYDKGFPLKLMRVAAEYGEQTSRPTIKTLRAIVNAFVEEYVNKIFNGAASGHNIGTAWVYGYLDTLTYPYVLFPFESGFDCLMDMIKLGSAARYKQNPADWSGLHWIMDNDGNILLAPVGNHNVYGQTSNHLIETKWATYASVTPIEVTKQMILQSFTKSQTEANYVLVAGKIVLPQTDLWCEDASLWECAVEGPTITDDLNIKKVGTRSMKFTTDDIYSYFRLKEDLSFTFDKITKGKTPLSIALWFRRGYLGIGGGETKIMLMKDWNNFFFIDFSDKITGDDVWIDLEFQLGEDGGWSKTGTLEWSDVHYIGTSFKMIGISGNCWVDGIKIIGNVVRAAYDSTSIATPVGCRMATVKDSLASTDTLDANDDSSPLARFILSELLKAREPLITGSISIPLAPTFLPGQLQHMHGARKVTGFNIDRDFRFVEVKHVFIKDGAITVLNVNSDLKNSLPRGGLDPYSALMRAVNPDFQTKTLASLRTGAEFDIGLQVLAKDYPS
jgi:hypothetical protein